MEKQRRMTIRLDAVLGSSRGVRFAAWAALAFSVACGSSDTSEPGNAGGQSASGGSDGGSGGGSAPTLCGGAYPEECWEGYFCRYLSGCGTVGHCTRRPRDCDDVDQPVCGCDGTTYGNECSARLAGVAVRDVGACVESEQFPCGPYRCARTSSCFDKGEASDDLWRYACLELPDGCSGCDCLEQGPGCFSGSTCQETAGGLTVTCN